MNGKRSLGGKARSLFNFLHLERLRKAVERLLIRRLHPKKNKPKSCAAHKLVILKAKTPKAHIAIYAHSLVKIAPYHLIAEIVKPLPHGECSRIIHNLFDAVTVDKHIDFIYDIERVARTVRRIKRCPAAESALGVPAIAPRHNVCSWGALEVSVLVGIKLPIHKIAINPRSRVEIVIKLKRPCVFHLAAFAIPNAAFKSLRIKIRLHQILEKKIPVSPSEDEIDRRILHRLLWKRGYVIAHKNRPREERQNLPHTRNPFPVALDHRRLRLHHHKIRLKRNKLALKLIHRHFTGDSIEKKNIVPSLMKHRGCRGGNDRKNIRRTGEPLELAVLG